MVFQSSSSLWVSIVRGGRGSARLQVLDLIDMNLRTYQYRRAVDAIREGVRIAANGGGKPDGWMTSALAEPRPAGSRTRHVVRASTPTSRRAEVVALRAVRDATVKSRARPKRRARVAR